MMQHLYEWVFFFLSHQHWLGWSWSYLSMMYWLIRTRAYTRKPLNMIQPPSMVNYNILLSHKCPLLHPFNLISHNQLCLLSFSRARLMVRQHLTSHCTPRWELLMLLIWRVCNVWLDVYQLAIRQQSLTGVEASNIPFGLGRTDK